MAKLFDMGKDARKAWFKKNQKILSDWLAAWQAKAKEEGADWRTPGMGNGLMAAFIGEALEMGAATLNDPENISDTKTECQVLASLLDNCYLWSDIGGGGPYDGPVRVTNEGNVLHLEVKLGAKFKITVSKVERL